ncbi:hypothetical protein Smic_75690 [Streptomyces microflavus]|uniref:Uncharacterized protein n=1 Tax=Streptomyces microflavus TaxID=1919 RepID=A0A7J0D2N0_STRMI|nr:hypothetical protein Smic_75690 [Streptomyces microflavus]
MPGLPKLRVSQFWSVTPAPTFQLPASKANGPVVTRRSPGLPLPPRKSSAQSEEVVERSRVQSQ